MKKYWKLWMAIILLILYIISCGYKLTPLSAAKANPFVNARLDPIEQITLTWGTVYIFRDGDYRRTVMAEKHGFFWRSSISSHLDDILDQDDKVKTVGKLICMTDNGQVTVFAVESTDPDVAYIEAGIEKYKTKKEISPGEIVVFVWNESLFHKDINPLALSKDGLPLYKYDYPQPKTSIIQSSELKWYPIED